MTVNPAPLVLICEIVTLEFPVFVSVTLCVALVPVVRLPKLSEAGLGVSWRMQGIPVPAKGTASGAPGALLTSVRLPVRLPAEAGANPSVKVEAVAGDIVSGNVNPETLKPVPACVTLRFAVPVFRIVSMWVFVTPTVTFPKLTLAGLTEICGCTPIPLNEITAGEFVAVLVTVTVPESVPVVAGANDAVNVLACPAARVTGKATLSASHSVLRWCPAPDFRD